MNCSTYVRVLQVSLRSRSPNARPLSSGEAKQQADSLAKAVTAAESNCVLDDSVIFQCLVVAEIALNALSQSIPDPDDAHSGRAFLRALVPIAVSKYLGAHLRT